MNAPARELSAFARSFLERFDSTEPALQPWLSSLRAGARARFAELDLPSARLEDWRFTPLRKLAGETFESPKSVAVPGGGGVDLSAHAPIRIEFVDGDWAEDSSGDLPAGIEIQRISAADAAAEFGRLASFESDGITALNTAGFGDGCVIRVSEDLPPETVIHLRFRRGGARYFFPRVLLIGEANSSVHVVEEHCGEGEYLNAPVVELFLHEGADWKHVRLQEEGGASRHLNRLAARLEGGASLRSDALVLDGGLVRNQIEIDLAGSGASCHLGGLVVAGGEQLVDHHTQIRHLVADTKSVERFRHVLNGRARGVFCGMVHVAPDAQRTDAEQSNRNLLLSDDAQMNTMPQLEIYADDVRCTHGATLGQLDADALFYLRARGIDAEHARSMLVHAFVDELVDELPLAALRDHVRAALARRLPGEVPLLEIG